jgi:NAD(P)-dependent dehydrogenase (short-subunit alcohol dehydrogenase family)
MDLGLQGRRALVMGGSRGLGKAVARALVAEGARVAIQIPARRLGRSQDFAAVAAFLASDQAGYITGQAIACDGGLLQSI